MVKLEKIVVQGFKSFKRNVSLPFPAGFSVVTGPNGTGKSNLGDAITFVLGRSSSRTLRAKKAQDLIFHGSRKKPGSDYAKVALYFDNSDSLLPFKNRMVSISRRLNQKGVSTYRLNGKIVTRQQVLDVFSHAGIHPNGHNIIQQGDVNQIIEMDAVERREILDEISGIMEYDEKKQKALNELGKIEEKVREAELILQEKQNILEKLRKERDTALEYKRLESDLEKIRASVLWKEYSQSERSLEQIREKLGEKEKEMESLEKKINEYDNRLKGEEDKLEELAKSVSRASKEVEVTKKISRIQSELEIKKDRLESNKREIERLNLLIERLTSVERRVNPAAKAVASMAGVMGTLKELIEVPSQYRIAAEVAAGAHMQDIVVDTSANAVKCVKYLKQNRIGRARFLPLDKIRSFPKKPLPTGSLGWLSELIHHDRKFSQAVDYVFGSTACVKDIDRAKAIFSKNRVRMVTLDGDLIETSGAITGGFYKKSGGISPDLGRYASEKKKLEKEIESLEIGIEKTNSELENLASKEKKTRTFDIESSRVRIDETLRRLREDRKEAYEKRLIIQQEIGKLNIRSARLEARFDNLKVQLEEHPQKKDLTKAKKEEEPEHLKPFIELEVSTLKNKEREVIQGIELLGPVNMKAIDDYDSIKSEFDEFRGKVDRIVEEKLSIEETINQIEEKRKTTFMHTMNNISRHFKQVYSELTGGEADLNLENPNNLESGLLIKAQPPGKKLLHIDSMSGGEKTLTAFAFLFAIQRHKPSPFYILDEADATLDKINTQRVAELIKKQSKLAQFIVISHNDALIREADRVYGVTMENGESKIIGIELPKAAAKQAQRNN